MSHSDPTPRPLSAIPCRQLFAAAAGDGGGGGPPTGGDTSTQRLDLSLRFISFERGAPCCSSSSSSSSQQEQQQQQQQDLLKEHIPVSSFSVPLGESHFSLATSSSASSSSSSSPVIGSLKTPRSARGLNSPILIPITSTTPRGNTLSPLSARPLSSVLAGPPIKLGSPLLAMHAGALALASSTNATDIPGPASTAMTTTTTSTTTTQQGSPPVSHSPLPPLRVPFGFKTSAPSPRTIATAVPLQSPLELAAALRNLDSNDKMDLNVTLRAFTLRSPIPKGNNRAASMSLGNSPREMTPQLDFGSPPTLFDPIGTPDLRWHWTKEPSAPGTKMQ